MTGRRHIGNGMVILLLILTASCAICRSSGSMGFQHGGTTLGKGDPDMPMLTLKVNVQRSEYLTGESLTIDLRLANTGDLSVEVPLADEESLFVYRLVSLEEKGPVYNFSQRYCERIIEPEIRTVREPEKRALPPGESIDYQEDLAKIATEPVLPGRYRLEVSYPIGNPTVYAPPQELTLKAPSIISFAPLVARQENTIIWAFAHVHADGSGSIFQRDSVKGHPELGLTYHRHDFDKKEQVSSVALSLDSPIRPGPRWIAWLQGTRLFGMFVWGRSVMASLSPIDIKLDHPKLISPGRQFAEGGVVMDSRAVFLMAGSLEGRTQIAECILPARAGQPEGPKETPARVSQPEGTKEAPARVGQPEGTSEAQSPKRPVPPIRPGGAAAKPAVRYYDLSAACPEFIRVSYLKEGFRLVWNENTSSGLIRIFSRAYGTDADGQSATLLYSAPEGKLVALETPPLQEEGQEYADALIEPVDKERPMIYVRIPLDTSKKATQWTFTKPVYLKDAKSDNLYPDLENTTRSTAPLGPDLWAIPTTPSDQPFVLAVLSDRLMMLEPTKEPSAWAAVAEGAGVASTEHLVLAHLYEAVPYGSRLWALWANPTYGLQYCLCRL